MARSLTRLFFSAAKKLSKIQRAAMRIAAPKRVRQRAAPARLASPVRQAAHVPPAPRAPAWGAAGGKHRANSPTAMAAA